MSFLKEWSCEGSSLATRSTLAEGVVAHGEDLPLLVEEEDVINATSNLLDSANIFNLDWLVIDK